MLGVPVKKSEGLTAKRAGESAACAVVMQSSWSKTGKLPHCRRSAENCNAR